MNAVPEAYYAGVGRVTIAAASLEMYLAEIASTVLGLETTKHFGDLAGRPGRAMRKVEEAAAARPDIPELSELHTAARSLFDERNGLVHGVIVTTAAPGPLTAPPIFYLSLQRPSDGSSRPLPSLEELQDLERRLKALATEVVTVWTRLIQAAADSVRTEEA